MSCGTCPTSAQPTTRKDGTASTPGSLLWSADVGAWYRQQRAQGQQPAITGTVAAPAPSRSAARPATTEELYAREILQAGAGPPHNLPLDNGENVAQTIAQADNALFYHMRDEGVTRLLLVQGEFLGGVCRDQKGEITLAWSGPYVTASAAQRNFQEQVEILERMAQAGKVRFHCLRCGGQLRATDGVCVDCPGAP